MKDPATDHLVFEFFAFHNLFAVAILYIQRRVELLRAAFGLANAKADCLARIKNWREGRVVAVIMEIGRAIICTLFDAKSFCRQ